MIVTLTADQTIENTFYRALTVVNFPDTGFDPTPLVGALLASTDVSEGAEVVMHVDSRPAEVAE